MDMTLEQAQKELFEREKEMGEYAEKWGPKAETIGQALKQIKNYSDFKEKFFDEKKGPLARAKAAYRNVDHTDPRVSVEAFVAVYEMLTREIPELYKTVNKMPDPKTRKIWYRIIKGLEDVLKEAYVTHKMHASSPKQQKIINEYMGRYGRAYSGVELND